MSLDTVNASANLRTVHSCTGCQGEQLYRTIAELTHTLVVETAKGEMHPADLRALAVRLLNTVDILVALKHREHSK